MSADVWLVVDTGGPDPARLEDTAENVTYNLSALLSACGFPGHRTMLGMRAREAARVYSAVAENLRAAFYPPERVGPVPHADAEERRIKRLAYLTSLLPDNGWGTVENALAFCDRMAAACAAHPLATVDGWL